MTSDGACTRSVDAIGAPEQILSTRPGIEDESGQTTYFHDPRGNVTQETSESTSLL